MRSDVSIMSLFVHCVGGCARCTFRSSYEDLEVPLKTAIQCTELPSSDANQTRQVLLNDGRQFVLTTASVNGPDVAAHSTSPSAITTSHVARMQVTANPGGRPADDAELPSDLSLRDEVQAVAAQNVIPPCPFCHRSNFATPMELDFHVNTEHPDEEDTVS